MLGLPGSVSKADKGVITIRECLANLAPTPLPLPAPPLAPPPRHIAEGSYNSESNQDHSLVFLCLLFSKTLSHK